jgi:AcrR family transcriptional regulator
MVQVAPEAVDAGNGSRQERRRHEILLAASRLFRRRGLHATGMRDIARELGMHVGNLYYYFENKQALLAYCQEATLARLLALASRLERSSQPADQRLRKLIDGHLRIVNEEIPASFAHLELDTIDGPRRRGILDQRAGYEATYRRLLREGIDCGCFRPCDPKVTAMAILGALNWTVTWYREEGEESLSTIASSITDLLLGGLLAPRDSASP